MAVRVFLPEEIHPQELQLPGFLQREVEQDNDVVPAVPVHCYGVLNLQSTVQLNE
jgi:hypothetical protein